MELPCDEVPGFRLRGLIDHGRGWRLHRAEALGRPGRPLLVEVHDTPPDGQLLASLRARTAELEHLEHPCLLPVLEVVALEERIGLVLPAVSGGSLSEAVAASAGGGLDRGLVDALAEQLSAALRLAHARELHHGALAAHRIRFDGRGRPVLLGVGTDALLTSARADAGHGPTPPDGAADTARPAGSARRTAAETDLEDLVRLLDACRAAPEQPDPTTAAVAPATGAQAPTEEEHAPAWHPRATSRGRAPRLLLIVAAALLLAAPVAVTLHATGVLPTRFIATLQGVPDLIVHRGAAPPTEAPPPLCADDVPPGDRSAPLRADLGGEGCTRSVGWDGARLTVTDPVAPDGRLRTLHLDAAEDDQLLFADLTCDGRDAPVLYRPATGEIFAFDRLASPGEHITVTGSPTGARGGVAVVVADLSGCDRIEVVDDRAGSPAVPG